MAGAGPKEVWWVPESRLGSVSSFAFHSCDRSKLSFLSCERAMVLLGYPRSGSRKNNCCEPGL